MSEEPNLVQSNAATPANYRTVTTASYDLRGNRVSRQLFHWLRMKSRVMGKYDTGPGLTCLFKLGILHCFGGPLFRLRIWIRSQYGLKARVRALIKKASGR